MTPPPFIQVRTAALSIVLTLTSLTCLRASGFSEGFVGIPSSTMLTSGNVPNWSQIGTANTSFISNAAGYPSGNGLRVTAAAAGGFYQPAGGGNTWSGADGTAYYSMDFYLSKANQQVSSFVMAQWQNYGFAVQVDGYGSQVLVSTGGASAYSPTTASYGATLTDNTWYTLTINGFTLGGNAEDTTGAVSIFETANPGTVLINNVAITAAGGANAFAGITFLQVAAYGNVTSTDFVQYDNLQLVPEPSTWALVGLSGLLLLLSKNRRNRNSPATL